MHLATIALTTGLAAAGVAAAEDCGTDPGAPRAVTTATCEASALLGDVEHLFQVYRYRSCRLAAAKTSSTRKAAVDEVVAMFHDPKAARHLARCREAEAAARQKDGDGR